MKKFLHAFENHLLQTRYLSLSANFALKDTSECFADACNHILNISLKESTNNAIKLHKICYVNVRELFGMSANLAVRSIRRVAACLTKLKGKRKRPKKFVPKSIDYDARIFSYREKDETVSLNTTKGRIRIPMLLGEHQRRALKGQNPTSATVINKESTQKTFGL